MGSRAAESKCRMPEKTLHDQFGTVALISESLYRPFFRNHEETFGSGNRANSLIWPF